MKASKMLWFIAGAAIGVTATVLMRQAVALSSSEVKERGKEIYARGRKIVEEASKRFERR